MYKCCKYINKKNNNCYKFICILFTLNCLEMHIPFRIMELKIYLGLLKNYK